MSAGLLHQADQVHSNVFAYGFTNASGLGRYADRTPCLHQRATSTGLARDLRPEKVLRLLYQNRPPPAAQMPQADCTLSGMLRVPG